MEQLIYRVSRLLSVITIILWVWFLALTYEFIESEYIDSGLVLDTGHFLLRTNVFWYSLVSASILLSFNWLAFGKISVWIKKPAPKDEE